ncbi:MAG: glycosylphosphatidylinositol anchor biosynthesis [Phylliscum demangeonii]|nr:MAG: glycosylphosphatidylinositol anchor biosynthesis [Phylliscum demangeonii]
MKVKQPDVPGGYILAFLIGLRLLNALSVRTFFQPDEYFQSLEPAWAMAFGRESGAWITWEWRYQLRSSIQPTIFAAFYYLVSTTARWLGVTMNLRAAWLLVTPKVVQALIAALGDFYTWKLADRIYGKESVVPLATPSLIRVRAAILTLSGLMDRVYYGKWTLPLLRFLYYNLVQSLAVFYGTSPWHYYLSQGLPLLLTTAMPFSVVGFVRAFRGTGSGDDDAVTRSARRQLATTVLVSIVVLSLVSHKEVRFIYPLLPVLHLFAGEALVAFLALRAKRAPDTPDLNASPLKRAAVGVFLLVNVAIALYTTLVHQSGVISVMDYLRHEHEARHETPSASPGHTSIGFLMPCHSTPWRSHLVHPAIHAWALSCEPPVDMSAPERAAYMDEADRFYQDPARFLHIQMANQTRLAQTGRTDFTTRWPNYLVFFGQLEPDMGAILAKGEDSMPDYTDGWRSFNTHWHDDWRRRGDVIVWRAR